MTLFHISKNLMIRLVSALVLVPSFLAILMLGGLPWQSLMLLGCLFAGYEWLAMLNPKQQKRVWVCVLFSLALTWGIALQADINTAFMLCLSLSLVLMAGFRLSKIEKPVLLSMGVSYLGSAMLALLHIREVGGFTLAATLCGVVWLTDTGAFFTGKMLRGAKLAPDISPSKTWTGFIGGLCCAALMAYLCSMLFSAQKPLVVVGVGLGLSLAAHCGDLFESWVKRHAGVKDSGVIIPGHGGLLDRVDGLIMAALLLSVALWMNGFDLSWWTQSN
ncbi:MAG: phosphatidate cytidylyltransferase [Alphaproteobacteria bacterium]|nr:phosphatidate cytidylyltransferase [Alphaproteobacteria bacterium]